MSALAKRRPGRGGGAVAAAPGAEGASAALLSPPSRLERLQHQWHPVPGKNWRRSGPPGAQGPESPSCKLLRGRGCTPAGPGEGALWSSSRLSWDHSPCPELDKLPRQAFPGPGPLEHAMQPWDSVPKTGTPSRRHSQGSPRGRTVLQACPADTTPDSCSPAPWSPRACVRNVGVSCLGEPHQTPFRSTVRPRSAVPPAPW